MGMSMVKALILKVFRARKKDTTTNVMCIVSTRQEAVAKEVRALKSVSITYLPVT